MSTKQQCPICSRPGIASLSKLFRETIQCRLCESTFRCAWWHADLLLVLYTLLVPVALFLGLIVAFTTKPLDSITLELGVTVTGTALSVWGAIRCPLVAVLEVTAPAPKTNLREYAGFALIPIGVAALTMSHRDWMQIAGLAVTFLGVALLCYGTNRKRGTWRKLGARVKPGQGAE